MEALHGMRLLLQVIQMHLHLEAVIPDGNMEEIYGYLVATDYHHLAIRMNLETLIH